MTQNNIMFLHTSKLVSGIAKLKKDIEKSNAVSKHVEDLKKNLERHSRNALKVGLDKEGPIERKDVEYFVELRNAFEGELDMLNDYWKHCLCQHKKGA